MLEALAADVYTPARARVPPAAATEPKTGIRNHIQAGVLGALENDAGLLHYTERAQVLLIMARVHIQEQKVTGPVLGF